MNSSNRSSEFNVLEPCGMCVCVHMHACVRLCVNPFIIDLVSHVGKGLIVEFKHYNGKQILKCSEQFRVQ